MYEYFAGLMDGEGSWSIQATIKQYALAGPTVNFGPRMTMSLKYGTEVLDEIAKVIGGKVYVYGIDGNKWYLGGIDAMTKVTNNLLPYLRIKKIVAERFLYALSLFPSSRIRGNTTSSWNLDTALEVATIALTLNPSSENKTKKKEEFLNEIRKIYS